jgi:hypothetical protein
MGLDTFFVGCEREVVDTYDPDDDGFLPAFIAFEDRCEVAPPLNALEEVSGFSPFAIASLYWALMGKPDGTVVDAHPILGCVVEKPAEEAIERSTSPMRVPPMLVMFAQRDGCNILVAGNWLSSGPETEVFGGLGIRIDFTVLDRFGNALSLPHAVTIGVSGRAYCFALRIDCQSSEAATLKACSSWGDGTIENEVEILPPSVPPEGVHEFVEQLNRYTEKFIATGEANFVATMQMLKQFSKAEIQGWMSNHPMRLVLVHRGYPTQVGLQWAKFFGIPMTIVPPTPPLPPRDEGPAFPSPQRQWDEFIGWTLPRSFIQAVANIDDARHAEVVAEWQAVPFRNWLRGTRDQETPRSLSDVLLVLRRLSRQAVDTDLVVWLVWCSEA